MPRRLQPPSLRKASIENIACNFEDFWCARSPSDLEHSKQPDVFTPFQYLSDDMIQEIIDMLQKRELLHPHHFQLLLHSNIRRFKLDLKSLKGDLNYIIKTLGIRCQKLTHLALEELGHVGSTYFLCILMRNLPEILYLRLDHIPPQTCIGVIKAISENSPNLLELDLSNCFLEKRDLIYLCNYPHNPKLSSKLRKLVNQGGYELSKDTVVHLLKKHTHLQSLGTCDIVDRAFDQMYGEGFQWSKVVPLGWRHNLTEIAINGECFDLSGFLWSDDRLDLTLQCCPCLTKLALYGFMNGQSFQNVAKLKHLKSLSVSMTNSVNFSTFLAPLLSKIGDNLTDLKFSRLKEVSLVLIGKYCHNLESLEFYSVGLVSDDYSIDDDVTNLFSHLTKLTLDGFNRWNEYQSVISRDALCLLLQNATNLVRLECAGVIHLTDEVISEANRKHGFRHLTTCLFRACPISVSSMRMLLCSDNPLESLSVSDCNNISSEDINLVREEAQLRQFDIDIY